MQRGLFELVGEVQADIAGLESVVREVLLTAESMRKTDDHMVVVWARMLERHATDYLGEQWVKDIMRRGWR